MATAHCLVLGGGFGGLAAAHRLHERLGDGATITLIDRRGTFMMGLRILSVLVGQADRAGGTRSLDRLAQKGIRYLRDEVTVIDLDRKTVTTQDASLAYDALVVALGAELAPENIPGFASHAFNVYDTQDVSRAAEALQQFRGGKITVGIFGAPYKCPPAPYEMVLLVKDFLRARGVRATLEVFTPQPMSLPILGRVGCDVIESRLAEAGITFLPNHKATAVEAGEVVFASGRRPYDLLLGVPPHRCPAPVQGSGLMDGGNWVRVNPRTLETKFSGVYAVGDSVEIPTADGKPLPKAGVFAEAMGQVAAERIAATLAGQGAETTFTGEGGCYLEVGNGQAMMVQGSFLAEPAPQVTLTEPSRAYLEQKRAFEAERLQTWFAEM